VYKAEVVHAGINRALNRQDIVVEPDLYVLFTHARHVGLHLFNLMNQRPCTSADFALPLVARMDRDQRVPGT